MDTPSAPANARKPLVDSTRPRPAGAPAGRPRVDSRTLLGTGGELVIDHDGREYHLRITQNGKLILTA